jgi:hypothetical protein
MSSYPSLPLARHAPILVAAIAFAAGSANAQFAPSHDPSSSVSATESSSIAGQPIDEESIGGAALPADSSTISGGGQEGGYGGNGGYHQHSLFSHMTFEAGGGANGPTSASSNDVTWGGNITVGAGYRFNPMFSLMTDYQFIDDKLPGRLISEAGATGGNAHIWSFTANPVLDLMPKSHNNVYVTGGGGFYRKVTNFTDPEPAEYCTYFYCGVAYQNTVVGHFSSNQGGWNIGGGFSHRMGGIYGDSKMKIFAEVRYLEVLSPAVTTSANGLGVTSVSANTKLIPITFGVRW